MRLVFGHLAGGPAPYEIGNPEHSFVLAFQALPLILLVSVLSKLIYHWGILQRVVRGFAWALERTMGVDGPVATGAAANIFIGMVEAPLLIRPYLKAMSRDGLLMVPKEPGDAVQSDSVLLLDEPPRSAMEAIAEGTREGVGLLIGVMAMLIFAVALVSLVNMGLAAVGGAIRDHGAGASNDHLGDAGDVDDGIGREPSCAAWRRLSHAAVVVHC
jgi:CNT family concentrative nucleoside transporter